MAVVVTQTRQSNYHHMQGEIQRRMADQDKQIIQLTEDIGGIISERAQLEVQLLATTTKTAEMSEEISVIQNDTERLRSELDQFKREGGIKESTSSTEAKVVKVIGAVVFVYFLGRTLEFVISRFPY